MKEKTKKKSIFKLLGLDFLFEIGEPILILTLSFIAIERLLKIYLFMLSNLSGTGKITFSIFFAIGILSIPIWIANRYVEKIGKLVEEIKNG